MQPLTSPALHALPLLVSPQRAARLPNPFPSPSLAPLSGFELRFRSNRFQISREFDPNHRSLIVPLLFLPPFRPRVVQHTVSVEVVHRRKVHFSKAVFQRPLGISMRTFPHQNQRGKHRSMRRRALVPTVRSARGTDGRTTRSTRALPAALSADPPLPDSRFRETKSSDFIAATLDEVGPLLPQRDQAGPHPRSPHPARAHPSAAARALPRARPVRLFLCTPSHWMDGDARARAAPCASAWARWMDARCDLRPLGAWGCGRRKGECGAHAGGGVGSTRRIFAACPLPHAPSLLDSPPSCPFPRLPLRIRRPIPRVDSMEIAVGKALNAGGERTLRTPREGG